MQTFAEYQGFFSHNSKGLETRGFSHNDDRNWMNLLMAADSGPLNRLPNYLLFKLLGKYIDNQLRLVIVTYSIFHFKM